jgi:tRNA threonylcarbamoyladenosine biosynthesis protein TsaB
MVAKDVNAVAVSIGPGSYTGLRVGLSAAKGFCYAMDIPLVPVGSLPLAAYGALGSGADLVCPMIDARRMEVYMALYDRALIEIKSPSAVPLDQYSFLPLLESNRVIFCGSGSDKLKKILSHDNALFVSGQPRVFSMPHLSFQSYQEGRFASIAYSEPLYLKEYYPGSRKLL